MSHLLPLASWQALLCQITLVCFLPILPLFLEFLQLPQYLPMSWWLVFSGMLSFRRDGVYTPLPNGPIGYNYYIAHFFCLLLFKVSKEICVAVDCTSLWVIVSCIHCVIIRWDVIFDL